jgi:hypothetical protein
MSCWLRPVSTTVMQAVKAYIAAAAAEIMQLLLCTH